MNTIRFISAHNGGITMHLTDSVETLWENTATEIAELIVKHGLADMVYGSSTMDFADEEGFATRTGAREMWLAATDLVNSKEVV